MQQQTHFISKLYDHPPYSVDARGEHFEIELARLATAIANEGAAARRDIEALADTSPCGRKGTDSVIEDGVITEDTAKREGIVRHLAAYRPAEASSDRSVSKFLEWRNRTRRPPRVDPITTVSERR